MLILPGYCERVLPWENDGHLSHSAEKKRSCSIYEEIINQVFIIFVEHPFLLSVSSGQIGGLGQLFDASWTQDYTMSRTGILKTDRTAELSRNLQESRRETASNDFPGTFQDIALPDTGEKPVTDGAGIFPAAGQSLFKHRLFPGDSCHEKNRQGKTGQDSIR